MLTRALVGYREALNVLADYESFREFLDVVRLHNANSQSEFKSPEGLSGWLRFIEKWNSEISLRSKKTAAALITRNNKFLNLPRKSRAKVNA